MARKDWKQPISITLSKEILKTLRELSRVWNVSRSSVVEHAIACIAAGDRKKP